MGTYQYFLCVGVVLYLSTVTETITQIKLINQSYRKQKLKFYTREFLSPPQKNSALFLQFFKHVSFKNRDICIWLIHFLHDCFFRVALADAIKTYASFWHIANGRYPCCGKCALVRLLSIRRKKKFTASFSDYRTTHMRQSKKKKAPTVSKTEAWQLKTLYLFSWMPILALSENQP